MLRHVTLIVWLRHPKHSLLRMDRHRGTGQTCGCSRGGASTTAFRGRATERENAKLLVSGVLRKFQIWWSS